MSGIPPAAPPLLTADSPLLGSIFGPPVWGIFDQFGNPIIAVTSEAMVEVDSVAAVEYARDYRISNYPQESQSGAPASFNSYNKVQIPYQSIISFFVGPSRFSFFAAVEAATASLNLFVVATPEVTYPNANLTHCSYRRDVRNGVTLIRIDVYCEEVRIALVSFGSSGQINSGNTSSNNGAQPTNSGTVQAVPPSPLPANFTPGT